MVKEQCHGASAYLCNRFEYSNVGMRGAQKMLWFNTRARQIQAVAVKWGTVPTRAWWSEIASPEEEAYNSQQETSVQQGHMAQTTDSEKEEVSLRNTDRDKHRPFNRCPIEDVNVLNCSKLNGNLLRRAQSNPLLSS